MEFANSHEFANDLTSPAGLDLIGLCLDFVFCRNVVFVVIYDCIW